MLWVGEVKGCRGRSTKAILDEHIKVIGAKSNPFEEHDCDPGQDSPEEGGAAGPAGNKQHPGIGRNVPESQHNNPVEKEHDVQEVMSVNDGAGRAHSMDEQDHTADEEDHQVSNGNY